MKRACPFGTNCVHSVGELPGVRGERPSPPLGVHFDSDRSG